MEPAPRFEGGGAGTSPHASASPSMLGPFQEPVDFVNVAKDAAPAHPSRAPPLPSLSSPTSPVALPSDPSPTFTTPNRCSPPARDVATTELPHHPLLALPPIGAPLSGAASASQRSPPLEDTPTSQTEHARAGKRKRRRAAREASKGGTFDRKVRSPAAKHVSGVPALHVAAAAPLRRIATGAYVGVRQSKVGRVWTVEELMSRGFTYVAWDGRCVRCLSE